MPENKDINFVQNPGPVDKLKSADNNSTNNRIDAQIRIINETKYDFNDEDSENDDPSNYDENIVS